MEEFLYTKYKIIDLFKNNNILNSSLLLNKEKNIILILKKNTTDIQWKYNISIIQNKNILWNNSSKDMNNYLNSIDALHTFLIVKKLLPLNSWIILTVDWTWAGSNDLFSSNNNQFNPANIMAQQNADYLKTQKIKKVLTDFESNLNTKLLNISDIITDESWNLIISDLKNWIIWSYSVDDMNLWKALLISYLANIPKQYKLGVNIEKEIVIFINKWENIRMYIQLNENNTGTVVQEYNNLTKDFSLPFTLCSLEDLVVDTTRLTNWISDFFYSFKINKVLSINF